MENKKEEEKPDGRTQYANIRYRTKRYGTWQPCKITLPMDIRPGQIHKFIKEDLDKQGIKYTEMVLDKITNF